MSRLPPLASLRVFLIAARSENFSAAADALCVTPSAVSHQIRVLEKFLHRQLFIRIGNKMELTQVGKNYAKELDRIFADLETATRGIREGGGSEKLTIGVASSFASAWLVPRLASFVRQYPHIQIQIVTSPAQKAQRTDCEIRYGLGKWPGYVVEKLWTERLQLMAAPEEADIQSLSDLGARILICTDSRVHGWNELAEKYALPFPPGSAQLHFDRTALATEAAKSGMGIALESAFLAQSTIRNSELKILLPEVFIEDETYHLVYEDRKISEALQSFRIWLQDQISR